MACYYVFVSIVLVSIQSNWMLLWQKDGDDESMHITVFDYNMILFISTHIPA